MLATWQARSGEFYSPCGKPGVESFCKWNLAHGKVENIMELGT